MTHTRLALIVLALLPAVVVPASGCSESNPCKSACSKFTSCFAPKDKGAPDLVKSAGALFAAPTPTCTLSEECSPKEACLAECISGASCEALLGKDLAAAKTYQQCVVACSTKKWDTGVDKPKSDLGAPGKDGVCKRSCVGKQCGPDGCGGQCGTCIQPAICDINARCVGGCQPQCDGKECGPDGCAGGGVCGTCPTGDTCNPQGRCEGCPRQCAGKECGPDGCGGVCGTCPTGDICNPQGHCEGGCPRQCAGKVCGPDGCGGDCGTCKNYETCNAGGQCEQTACGPIRRVGCCDGQILKWCENGAFRTFDCNSNPSCGWEHIGGVYDCGTPGGSDPSGVNPRACP